MSILRVVDSCSRTLFLVLVTLFFVVGCGDSVDQDSVDQRGSSTQTSTPQPIVITAQNGLQLDAAVAHLSVTSGRDSVEFADGDLSQIEIDSVAAALAELPLAYPTLVKSSSASFNGPGGGSAQLTVQGTKVIVTFLDFVSQDGAILDGSAEMSGQIRGDVEDVEVTFSSLRLTDSEGSFQIDGPVTLYEERIVEPQRFTEVLKRTQNATITDLTSGGFVRYIDGTTEDTVVVENGVEKGTAVVEGTFLFENYDGLNGLVVRGSVTPFTFTVDLSTQISSVLTGENFLQGDGYLRRRITSADMLEIAVRPTGLTNFQVLGVHDLTDRDTQ